MSNCENNTPECQYTQLFISRTYKRTSNGNRATTWTESKSIDQMNREFTESCSSNENSHMPSLALYLYESMKMLPPEWLYNRDLLCFRPLKNHIERESKSQALTLELKNTINQLTTQNSATTDRAAKLEVQFEELSKLFTQLTHLYAQQEAVIANLQSHMHEHEQETHCNGASSNFGDDEQ